MNTSQYDSKTRKMIKRYLRSPAIKAIGVSRREHFRLLESTITKRNEEIDGLRKAIQGLIDQGHWRSDWEKLGFTVGVKG